MALAPVRAVVLIQAPVALVAWMAEGPATLYSRCSAPFWSMAAMGASLELSIFFAAHLPAERVSTETPGAPPATMTGPPELPISRVGLVRPWAASSADHLPPVLAA